MSDDDPLFRLMERMCRLDEQLPSEEEVLHDENARHRAMMLSLRCSRSTKKSGRWGSVNESDELVELARNHEKRKNRIEKSLIDNGGLEPLVIGITNYAVYS